LAGSAALVINYIYFFGGEERKMLYAFEILKKYSIGLEIK
jgi:hypothetical protein